MIRYGTHSYLFTEKWSDDRLFLLDEVRALGCDLLEIAVGDDVHFTPRHTRQRAEQIGLALTIGPGGHWPMACDLSSDDAARRRLGLVWHRRQVDLAAELGAIAYGGALYGHPGAVQRRKPPADEYARTAEGLHRLAEHGRERGVQIVLEPMSHFRTHLVNTPRQAMRLIDMAAHDNLWVLLDTYHLVTEIRDFRDAVISTQDRLWGIHACENDRGVPGGGLVPWAQLFAALREIDFAGNVLLESYNSSIDDFAWRRGMFHDVCPDGYAFTHEGLAFVRSRLEPAGGGDEAGRS